jgi:hypothetical protein
MAFVEHTVSTTFCCDCCSGHDARLLTRELEVDVTAPVRLYTWNTSFAYPNRFLSLLLCQPYCKHPKLFLFKFVLWLLELYGLQTSAAPPVRIRILLCTVPIRIQNFQRKFWTWFGPDSIAQKAAFIET